MAHDDERDVVYLERDGGSIRPILFGALLGLAAGLLFAPQSGDETRRMLKRRLRKVRALAEEKVDELADQLGGESRPAARGGREARRDEVRGELERRLAEARARRRAGAGADADDEEPVA